AERVETHLPGTAGSASTHAVENVIADACVRRWRDCPRGAVPVLGERVAVRTDAPDVGPTDRAHRLQRKTEANGTGIVARDLYPGCAVPLQDQGPAIAARCDEIPDRPDFVRRNRADSPQVIEGGSGVRAGHGG